MYGGYGASGYGQFNPYQQQQQQQQPPVPPQPQQPQQSTDSGLEELIGLLRHMDKEDLQKLLDSDDKINELIKGSKDLQQLQQDKQTAMASNRSIAEYNLSQRSRIEEAKAQLKAKTQEAANLRSTFDVNRSRLGSLNSAANTDTLLNLLESAAMEAEESSEQLLDSFISKSLSIEEFIRQYLEARQTYHLRKIKADKLTGLANRQYAQPSRQQRQQQHAGAWQSSYEQQQQQQYQFGSAGYSYN